MLYRDFATREELDREYDVASWGGDPGRIHVAGHSAGAQQVAMVPATAVAELVRG